MLRALIAAALCALLPAVARSQALPPLPDSVPSQLGYVRVLRVEKLTCGGQDALGCYDGDNNTIAVRAGISRPMAWMTLYHEQVHMTLWLSGQSLGGEREDRMADAIAAARVAEMLSALSRRRP